MSLNITFTNLPTQNSSLNHPTSNTTTQDEDQSDGDLWKSAIIGFLLCVLIFMTIGGNLLVIIAISINRHLRITTNYFILNLAIADLLLGTTVLPFSASLEVVDYWAFGETLCNIWAAFDVLCCTASIMSLCVISIDRYIGVTRPLQHSSIVTESRATVIIVVVWLLAAAISVAPLAGWKEPPPEDETICEVTKQLGYVLFSVAGSFYIPLTIILVVYFRVYKEATKQSRFLATGVKRTHAKSGITLRIHYGRPSNHNHGGASSSLDSPQLGPSPSTNNGPTAQQRSASLPGCHGQLAVARATPPPPIRSTHAHSAGRIAKFKREKKAAKTLGIVVGVFIMCWFPFFFVLPLDALCPSCVIPGWLFKIIFWLGYCNSTMNPIIYACSSREFKRAFIRILNCTCRNRFPSYITNQSKFYQRESRLSKMTSAVTRWRHGNRGQTGSNKGHNHNVPTNGDTTPNCTTLMIDNTAKSNGNHHNTHYNHLDLNQPIKRKDTVDSMVISEDESAIQEFSSDEGGDTDQSHRRLQMNLDSILEEMKNTQRSYMMNALPLHENPPRAQSMNPIGNSLRDQKMDSFGSRQNSNNLSISDTALCIGSRENMLSDQNDLMIMTPDDYRAPPDNIDRKQGYVDDEKMLDAVPCLCAKNSSKHHNKHNNGNNHSHSNTHNVVVSRSFHDTPYDSQSQCSPLKSHSKHCSNMNTAYSESNLQTPASVKRKLYNSQKHFGRLRMHSIGSQDYPNNNARNHRNDAIDDNSPQMIIASTNCYKSIPVIVIEPACVYETVSNV